MAQFASNDEIEPPRIEPAEIATRLRSPFQYHTSSPRASSELFSIKDDLDDDYATKWAEYDRLPTFVQLRSSLLEENKGSKRVIEVTKTASLERHVFVEKLIKHIENDNLRLLQKMRKRIDKVGVELPRVVVRYNNLRVEAECEVVHGKPLPTLWNSLKSFLLDCTKVLGLKPQKAKINIIDDFSGIIKPGRMTLLLGPPGCGKTTLLKALSGNLDKSLKVSGEVFYNGYKLEDCIPQKTSAYISQNDLHMPEMTVREALDFSARCQGVGTLAEIMAEVSRREEEAQVVPDPDIDTYMKEISIEGQKTTLQTDYILKILGLDICADTLVGDAMRRGVSGGQKKRLTTGEMIIGPTKALFMDEISNGLDSSTTYQVIVCLQQLAHITDATILVGLLQPAPETFDLFDDIILMAEGKIVYHGPCSHVLGFFEDCGFRCPERKGVADFLQEVISRKDQAQYWHQAEQPYSCISVDMFSKKFKESTYGKKLDNELSLPFMKSRHKSAISFSPYSLSKWELFKACISREYLLMRRNYFLYVFKSTQLLVTASITATIFLRGTRSEVNQINIYLGALFLAVIMVFFDGLPELSLTVARLAVFYKQRDLCFYPAWSYAISSTILKTLAGNTTTIGNETLEARGLYFSGHFFWISVGALIGFAVLFNIGFTLALTFLNPPRSRAIISNEKLSQIQGSEDSSNVAGNAAKSKSYQNTTSKPQKDQLVLPFKPLCLTFKDVQYSVEAPLKKLQLLCDITGALKPGVLTALMGVSGAGKTTLLDVLAGRKTSGTVEGNIRIGGHPKLVLLKIGGRVIYSGPLGQHSSSVIKYFEDVSGVPKIRNNYNPATWMLEVTSKSAEAELGIDFAQVYMNSVLYKNNKALVNSLSIPPDSKKLHFATRFSQDGWGQFKSCLWKQHLSYWRNPSYTLMRSMYSLISSLLFGILFWDQGTKIDNQLRLSNVLAAIATVSFFTGVNNCSSVLPYVSTERSVLYREKYAGMYGSWAYALAQVMIEVPYLLGQAMIFVIITYPMVGFYWSTFKVLWYFYAIFCTLTYYTFLGMLLIAMTPSFPIAVVLQSPFYTIFNLFAGFFITEPQIPKWWTWMYYLVPTSWTLKGVLTSQYGDIQEPLVVFGQTQTVKGFLRSYFGYNHDQLVIVGVALLAYPVVFALLFAYCIQKLNYQKR
ncbi:hypothetical protein RHGRI_031994 [Rhododendron griersonianum]|uniref:ABC transporter domain-containing protein n=1 Tax=Rhododendron griersonianum TaxID=479676 RepID=A0AAV6IFT9_9ERIC|nr:hypothetical protein RHGRI_031994 [Rhododendron griersonianum]